MPITKVTYRKNKNGVLIGSFRSKSRGIINFTGSSKRRIRKAVTNYDFK
jgi:hypothetical protein